MLKIGLLLLVTAPAAIYAVGIVVVYLIQRRLLYFPTHRDAAGKGNGHFAPWSTAAGFLGYVREGASAKKILLFFHGNGGEALDRDWLSDLDPEGQTHIILAEYPGYGAKPGSPTEKSLYEAALKIYDEVTQRWPLPVTLVAESLGSGVAAYLASQRPVSSLALIAPFTSALELAVQSYRFVPVRLLMQDRYESIKHLEKVKVPLSIVHGTLDDVIPVRLGKQLLASYSGSEKRLEEVPGYGHNNIPAAVVDSPFAEQFRGLVLQ